MFDRFKNRPEDPATHRREGNGRTAVADPPATRTDGTTDSTDRTAVAEPGTRREPLTRDHMHAARARQRDEFGGINWGAAFFGWLVAVGLGSLLLGIVAAAGTAIGLTEVTGDE